MQRVFQSNQAQDVSLVFINICRNIVWKEEHMPLRNISLSKSDFDACEWQKTIEQCQQKECRQYLGLLFIEAGKAEQSANIKAQEVFTLLGGIASLNFRLDNKQLPFEPLMESTTLSRRT
jgi:hypothetical protein